MIISKTLTDVFAGALLGKRLLLLAGATAAISAGWAAPGESTPEDPSITEQPGAPALPTHLSEELRSSIKKVVVLPTTSPVDQALTGSYEQETRGLIDGAEAGSRIGRGAWTEIGGIPVGIPIPILTVPGALIGGISGATKREMQEFRDELTDELTKAASQPLSNEALASDVFWAIRKVPSLDSKLFALTTPIPDDTDAILYVNLTDLTIHIDGGEAVITTTASATLRRLSDGEHLYENEIHYEDRDSLSNWTNNENALWRDYANFARHYIGREISAEVFDRVELRHELHPQATDSVKRVRKNDWQSISRSSSPTLAWNLNLLGDDSYGAWTDELNSDDISYDVEIYDNQRLVYSAKRVAKPSHEVAEELEACKSYRWSVRPSYRVGSGIKFGEWMRFSSNTYSGKANVGKKASEAPAYTQDFALLEIKC